MFDLRGNERLTEWRKIRDNLSNSLNPYAQVLEIWKKAPLVNQYLDPFNSGSWPDPWHLILDDRYDDLAISLGIVYTLALSDRFMRERFEIHMSISEDDRESFFVVSENTSIDVCQRIFVDKQKICKESKRIWSYQNKS